MLSCEQVEKFKKSKMEKKTSILELESFLPKELQKKVSVEEEFNEDTTCGFGFIRGKWLQRLASKKTFLIVQGLTGMIFNASFHYLSGTLTTLEKQYKFSSAQMGYINAVYDIFATAVALIAPYYCSKGKIPRWMGFSLVLFTISYIIYMLPYFLFGTSEEILALTEEYGRNFNPNTTQELFHEMKMKELCYENSKYEIEYFALFFNCNFPETMNDCTKEGNNTTLYTGLLFALSSALAGCGGAIYGILGATYIDDNVKKSQAPLLFCIASFVRLLGPALGYNMASYFLKFYVQPDLHPKINDEDPRWIGAWWIGYMFFTVSMLVLAPLISMFPKTLPRAALRRKQELLKKMKNVDEEDSEKNSETSFKGCLKDFEVSQESYQDFIFRFD